MSTVTERELHGVLQKKYDKQKGEPSLRKRNNEGGEAEPTISVAASRRPSEVGSGIKSFADGKDGESMADVFGL